MNTKNIFIGFSDSLHDRTVCLFKDGQPIVAIEEERLTRVKHGLDIGNYSKFDPEIFAKMNLESDSASLSESRLDPLIKYCLEAASVNINQDRILIGNSLHNFLPYPQKSLFINHHLAHAASAFFPSGAEDAAILVTDGYGDSVDQNIYETVLLGYGLKNKIVDTKVITGKVSSYFDMQNSLGVFYRIGTLLSGFGVLEEGKTMGLAGYGQPIYREQILKHVQFRENAVLIKNGLLWESLKHLKSCGGEFEESANIASSFQKVLEEIIFYYCQCLYKLYPTETICLAGGVALNCVANAKILEATNFKKVFVFPAAGDNGIAFGAGYYLSHQIYDFPRQEIKHAFWGRSYSDLEITNSLRQSEQNLTFQSLSEDKLIKDVAELIAAGEIVMWFNGGAEIGPRALGHRSILASPVQVSTKDFINSSVKFRESFRPLAPMVLEEFAQDFFELNQTSPFMLLSPKVKSRTLEQAPAIVHCDQTARLQTINRIDNPKIYKLIFTINELTNVPIILNTSMNGQGEPIVETPMEAIQCFLKSPLNYLVINNFLIKSNVTRSSK